jgi:carboxylesterase
MIIPNAEPFFYPGDQIGCLLVHGFTATPEEMHTLGEYLADQGHTVLGVRLFGHGTSPKDMIRSRWQDWFASVEDGWHLLRKTTKIIYMMGFSMGGALSLLFASQNPVSGVVAIATPHHLPKDPRLPFIKILSLFKPYYPKGIPVWFDEEAYRHRVVYPIEPTRSYAELNDLLIKMRSALHHVTAPVLLIYSKQDPVIRAKDHHMESIYDALGSQIKHYLWIENSGHIMTRDLQREKVFFACKEFINGAYNNRNVS